MSTLLGILAILSAAAAAGMRIALPLLIVGLIQGQLWSEVPLLWRVNPQVVVAVLTSWSLFELFGSKKLLGQRVLQIVQLLFTPLVGAMMAITVARLLTSELASQLEMDFRFPPLWVVGAIGSLFALAIRLVAIGWFFSLAGVALLGNSFRGFILGGTGTIRFQSSQKWWLNRDFAVVDCCPQFHCLENLVFGQPQSRPAIRT